jgi:alpha-ketoglutarate-dependent taurine dioxygenase
MEFFPRISLKGAACMTIFASNIFETWGLRFDITEVEDMLSYDDDLMRRQLYDRKMIVIRGNTGNAEDFWRICSKVGRTMDADEYKRGREKHDALLIDGVTRWYGMISNIISPRLGSSFMPWHADNPDIGDKSYPIRCLRMVTCPNTDAGFTGFLDIERAWQLLPNEMRENWLGYRIEQQSWYEAGTNVEIFPSIKIHPITGRSSPMVNHHNHGNVKDAWIRDMFDRDNNRIGCGEMTRLIKAMETVPDCTYQHRWEEGDIIMYDNFSLLHNRTDLEITQAVERLMWRINVVHDRARPLMQHTSG